MPERPGRSFPAVERSDGPLGKSWSQIGSSMGITRQAAHRAVRLVSDETGRRVRGDAAWPMPAFSVTKMFVAVAALRLAEQGVLDLDSAASRWEPGVPDRATVRDLLRHTAGLPDYAMAPPYLAAVASGPDRPWTHGQILAAALAGDCASPGKFRYSNAGYWILGQILESVSGGSLAGLLRTEVFDVCELTATRYPEPGAGLTQPGYDTLWAGPAGAAWSTAADLDLFLRSLFGGALLTSDSLAQMTTAVPAEAGPPWRAPGYGLGLMIDRELGIAGHGGAGPGFKTAAFTAWNGRRRAIVLTPSGSVGEPVHLALRLLRTDLALGSTRP
jgi:CubicO group peptidase (beta-lactamase class C family)